MLGGFTVEANQPKVRQTLAKRLDPPMPPTRRDSEQMTSSASSPEDLEFVPTSGSRLGGRSKDKKQRIAEIVGDLNLAMSGLAMRGEGHQPLPEMVKTVESLARMGSVFLRKLVLDGDARLLDDAVLRSLYLKLRPLRRIPRSERRPIRTEIGTDQVTLQLTRIADGDGNPVEPPQRFVIAGGRQGYSMRVEWPLLGMADWKKGGNGTLWPVAADQLFDTDSDRAMSCDEWLGQQVVVIDGTGITLGKILRTIVNFQGAHSINLARLTTVQGEQPSRAAKEPHVHIVRNLSIAGVGYMDLIAVEAALYLYRLLLDEPSIDRPSGAIYSVVPTFTSPAVEDVQSANPSWLRYLGEMILTFSSNPGIEVHRIRAPR